MEGGSISNNTAYSAVHLSSGTFTLEGGSISGNSSFGVFVNEGTFTMEGGSISGNASSGVSLREGTVNFTMKGGSISGNVRGVNLNNGTFIMKGGSISGNRSSSGGAGVYVGGGAFNMEGGIISGNTGSYGDGVFVANGTFSMQGSARADHVLLYATTSTNRAISIRELFTDMDTVAVIDLYVSNTVTFDSYWKNNNRTLLGAYVGGDLATLKGRFTLGNTELSSSPYTKTPINDYSEDGYYAINDTGKLVEIVGP
jgi:hypothetical protein